jgi:hypothetical protein
VPWHTEPPVLLAGFTHSKTWSWSTAPLIIPRLGLGTPSLTVFWACHGAELSMPSCFLYLPAPLALRAVITRPQHRVWHKVTAEWVMNCLPSLLYGAIPPNLEMMLGSDLPVIYRQIDGCHGSMHRYIICQLKWILKQSVLEEAWAIGR